MLKKLTTNRKGNGIPGSETKQTTDENEKRPLPELFNNGKNHRLSKVLGVLP
jgi:hypothetical protein